MGRSSSPVGYGIGIAEVVGSNPTRSTNNSLMCPERRPPLVPYTQYWGRQAVQIQFEASIEPIQARDFGYLNNGKQRLSNLI